jgi:hypothetical protein
MDAYYRSSSQHGALLTVMRITQAILLEMKFPEDVDGGDLALDLLGGRLFRPDGRPR